MSMSTQHDGSKRRPSAVSTGKKSPPGDKTETNKSTTKAAKKATPGTGKGGPQRGPRKQIKPIKVSQGRSWGPIAVLAAVILIAVGIIGYAAWFSYQGSIPWDQRADEISGVTNYRKLNPQAMASGQHQTGTLAYPQNPPVGGPHNPTWQNCNGDVYDAPIASEHAVHSMEHGAVWITYRPDLAPDQVEKLAAKVRGQEKMLMSPYENLDRPISLQAWGYQLKVDNADDGRIDSFIKALRVNASMEGPTANCGNGITVTGTTPRDLPQQQQ